MAKTIASYILRLALLILAQAVIFNNLVLFHVAVPLVFAYGIISMPVTWGTNVSMLIGFATGALVDIFSNTLGVYTLSCTILAFARKPIFHLYVQRDDDLSGLRPSQRSMGTAAFLKYALTMTLAFCVLCFTIDAFFIFSLWRYLLQIVASTAYTLIIIYALDSIFARQHEKRL